MPLFFGNSTGTSVNIDSDVPKVSNTTFTAARKFSSPDLTGEQEDLGVETRTNDEHMIAQAVGIQGVASAASSIADQARAQLSSVRSQLESTAGTPVQDARTAVPNRTESDLAAAASNRAIDLASLLQAKLPILDTRAIADDLHVRNSDMVFRKKIDVPAPTSFNPIVPQFDGITVDLDKSRGTIDCFFAHLKFSLPLSQVWNGRIKAVRIFRSTILHPSFVRGTPPTLSLRGMDRLVTLKMRSRVKVGDLLSSMEHRYREAGIANAVTSLSPIDPQTNLRLSSAVSDVFTRPMVNPAFAAAFVPRALPQISSFLDPSVYGSLDPSVGQDPNVIRNIINQNPLAGTIDVPRSFTLTTAGVDRQGLLHPSQLANLRPNGVAPIVVDDNNRQEFREIAFFSLDKLKQTIVGDQVQYEHLDESIGFGRAYKYYIVTVDKDMVESIRSQIIDVTVEGVRVPDRPKRVFAFNVQDAVAFNIIVDDQLVEKFEVFRREADLALAKQLTRGSSLVSDVNGFNVSLSIVNRGQNGFIKIGECVNGSKGSGATYYDREVIPGLKYMYRVYSVDIFGNKSESPYEVDVFVPEKSSRPNELSKPTIVSEVDANTNKAVVTFRCSDLRVRTLFLARRDLTIGQEAFTTPGQVNIIKLGTPKAGEGALHFEDVLLRGEKKDVAWTGFFESSGDDISFVDTTVSLDHVYQYRVHGVDLYGNSTPFEYSRKVMITRRPMISSPVNMNAEIVQGPNFTVGGIRLTWQDGNVDISSEDMLGNRDSLDQSSVRTLYQLERKKVGEERWYEFPLVENKTFFDPSPSSAQVPGVDSVDQANVNRPAFRPPFVETNQRYAYRVKAVQTGSFISNYATGVEIFSSLPVLDPTNFRVRSSDPKVKPFYIVLNWDTSNASGVVDKWEIERAEINNFAAARLNIKNPADFNSLDFKSFRQVFRESSRFKSQDVDQKQLANQGLSAVTNQTDRSQPFSSNFTGQHQFQDMDVKFGNTYFYRIRAVGVDGSVSRWSYRGMKLTEETIERVIQSIFTPEFKKELASTGVPFMIRETLPPNVGQTMSLVPSFAKPNPIPTVSVVPPSLPAPLAPIPLPTFISPKVVGVFQMAASTNRLAPYSQDASILRSRLVGF